MVRWNGLGKDVTFCLSGNATSLGVALGTFSFQAADIDLACWIETAAQAQWFKCDLFELGDGCFFCFLLFYFHGGWTELDIPNMQTDQRLSNPGQDNVKYDSWRK